MKHTKTYKVIFLRPDGQLEACNVPVFVDLASLARHRPHSEIFTFVPAKRSVWGEHGSIEGPCWTIWDKEHAWHYVVEKPLNELHATHQWRTTIGARRVVMRTFAAR